MSLSSFSSLGQLTKYKGSSASAASAGASVISSTGLVYYYPFETTDILGATCKNNIAGGTYDLTLVGSPSISTSVYKCGAGSISTTTGKYGGLTTNTNFYSADASFTFWFRVISIPATDTYGCLASCFNNGPSYNWFMQMSKNANNINFDLGIWFYSGASNAYNISGSTLTYNTWYHIAVVKTGTGNNLKIYLNGSVVVNVTSSSTLTNNGTGKFYIGIDNNQPTHVINGNIDDFRWYQRAITASEITTLYNNIL
jgi:hypothetical protein